MFLVNSRLAQFSAAQPGFGSKSLHPTGLPLSLSYGEILPSSLSMVLSIALESSSHLPASVCGTVTCVLARGFSWELGISHFTFLRRLLFASRRWMPAGFAWLTAYLLDRAHPIARMAYPSPSPHCS